MTIARAQMYRQLYQMGGSPVGIATMPMDYGQSLQVNNQGQGQQPLMSQTPNYSSAVNITANPLLNYGQSPLADAGGTPLTMRSGGITRLGYANGDVVNIEDQMMQQSQMQQPTQPPLQGMEGQQPDIKDPQQALDIIIQMLIAQGIPPEQAREIALQMVQAVAEGGMQEMSDERVEARFGGSMSNGREQYGLGSIFKGAAKAVSGVVKGVTNAVKSVVSSPIGKLALTAAALYYAPYAFGAQSAGLAGYAQAFPGVTASLMGTPGTLLAGDVLAGGTPGLLGNLGLTAGYGTPLSSGILGTIANKAGDLVTGNLLSNIAGGVIGGVIGANQQPPQYDPNLSPAENQAKVDAWKASLNTQLNNTTLANPVLPTSSKNPFYTQMAADGGRIGYGFGNLVGKSSGVVEPVSGGSTSGGGFGMGLMGKLIQQNPGMFNNMQQQYSPISSNIGSSMFGNGITDLIKQTTKQSYFDENQDYSYAADGGRMGYALGMEVPTRENQAGVKELDYRDTGGFVPPIGIKERADDIPAMLSNNEFVFTADAVRNAGGGDENLGAQRMYKLMKNLEAGGSV